MGPLPFIVNGMAVTITTSSVCTSIAFSLLCAQCQPAWDGNRVNSQSGPPVGGASFKQWLPPLRGEHLTVSIVEVAYEGGASSAPHRHPCPVIGRVLEGAIRMRTSGGAEKTFAAGQTFYEGPNHVHLVSANASQTDQARFLAFFVCDRDRPLSVDVP